MKAEEYYPIWCDKLKKKLGERGLISVLMQNDSEIIFAEAYHKARVEAITDKIIVQKSYERRGVIPSEIYRDGARWIKQKLLNN